MTGSTPSLRERYTRALSHFMRDREESGLREAYELGRQALSQGTGLLELADLHHEAVGHLSVPAGDGKWSDAVNSFFREALSPFEMTHRGYRETTQALREKAEDLRVINQKLQELNGSLEERVAEGVRTAELRAKELARVNGELQQFVLVASHDLREPLRMIVGFVQLLERRFPKSLDDPSQEYVRFVVEGAHRIQQLIEDLLAYTRIGGDRLNPRETDLGKSLRDALSNLKVVIEESGAVVEAEALPVVHADPSLMVLLLQNLVGNAIKFHGPEKPRVGIRSVEDGGTWVISVRDNGIGIDPKYFDRIFEVFQRLHTRDQYSGTGIGLALCRKIVEQHGGRIWVESAPGKGAVFHFSIPKGDGRNLP